MKGAADKLDVVLIYIPLKKSNHSEPMHPLVNYPAKTLFHETADPIDRITSELKKNWAYEDMFQSENRGSVHDGAIWSPKQNLINVPSTSISCSSSSKPS